MRGHCYTSLHFQGVSVTGQQSERAILLVTPGNTAHQHRSITPMSKFIRTALSVGLLTATAFAATSAGAWERSSSTTGPYGGTVSSHGSGSCSGGTCSSSQSVTGRYGRSATRSGSTSCSGGSCSGTATYIGRYGLTVTRSRSFHR